MILFMNISQNKNIKVWATIILLCSLVLFPYGWLANNWAPMGWVVDTIFGAEWMHWLGHMVMYGMMGTAVLIIFPQFLNRPHYYFGLILGIGLIQEALQLITFKHRFFMSNEIFDLFVNLLAAGIIFAVAKLIVRKQHKETY